MISDERRGLWARYFLSLTLLKLVEFVSCSILFAFLIYLFPEPPYYYAEKVDFGSALRGGLLATSLFFLTTLYPIVSFAAIFAVVVLQFRSRLLLGAAAALFSMGYVVLWVVVLDLSYPFSFWVAWFLMGLIIFFSGLALFPGGPPEVKQQ